MGARRIIVNEEELVSTDDSYGDIMLYGQLFDGVVYERDKEGRLISLGGYSTGKRHGAVRDWFPSGQIADEAFYHNGRLHGANRKWYKNGQPEFDAYFEYGYRTRMKSWNADGQLTEQQKIEPESPVSLKLLELRLHEGKSVVDIDLESWDFLERSIGWGEDPSALLTSSQLTEYAMRMHQSWRMPE